MDLETFRESLNRKTPPDGLGPCLRALWQQGKGDWEAAHQIAQDQDGTDGAWVHAHLHRVEGDAANAAYWYRRAGRPVPTTSPEEEWHTITAALLADAG